MRKLLIYVGVIVLLFALLFIVNHYSTKAELDDNREAALELYHTEPENLNTSTVKQLTDSNYQNIILPDELEQKLADKEDLIVYFFSPECRFCRESTPILTELADEFGVDILQYNVLEFGQGFQDYSFTSTPTTIVFEDGEEIDRFVGGFAQEKTTAQMKLFLEKHAN